MPVTFTFSVIYEIASKKTAWEQCCRQKNVQKKTHLANHSAALWPEPSPFRRKRNFLSLFAVCNPSRFLQRLSEIHKLQGIFYGKVKHKENTKLGHPVITFIHSGLLTRLLKTSKLFFYLENNKKKADFANKLCEQRSWCTTLSPWSISDKRERSYKNFAEVARSRADRRKSGNVENH